MNSRDKLKVLNNAERTLSGDQIIIFYRYVVGGLMADVTDQAFTESIESALNHAARATSPQLQPH